MKEEILHQPVLLKEVLEGLNLEKGKKIFDGTLGSGGYSEKILEKIGENGVLIATDLDKNSIEIAKKRIGLKENFKIFQKSFSEIKEILKELKIEKIDGIVLDLGWSSDQFQKFGKGFSFQNLDEELIMAFDEKKVKWTAKDILNFWTEEEIADIIFQYSEERGARLIAKKIVQKRKEKEIQKVGDLVEIIEEAVGKFYKNKKIHSATKTFQALRIAVNQELEVLEKVLEDGIEILENGGRFLVVTFHSLEDRLVKNIFRDWEKEGLGKRINKKVIKSTFEEVKNNPKSRSAKLRIFEKN